MKGSRLDKRKKRVFFNRKDIMFEARLLKKVKKQKKIKKLILDEKVIRRLCVSFSIRSFQFSIDLVVNRCPWKCLMKVCISRDINWTLLYLRKRNKIYSVDIFWKINKKNSRQSRGHIISYLLLRSQFILAFYTCNILTYVFMIYDNYEKKKTKPNMQF